MESSSTTSNIKVESKAASKVMIGGKEYTSADELPTHIPAAVRAKIAKHLKADSKPSINIKVNNKNYSPNKLPAHVHRKLDHNGDGIFNEDDVASMMQAAKESPSGIVQTSTRTTSSSSETFTSGHLNNLNWRTGIFSVAVIVIIFILFV